MIALQSGPNIYSVGLKITMKCGRLQVSLEFEYQRFCTLVLLGTITS